MFLTKLPALKTVGKEYVQKKKKKENVLLPYFPYKMNDLVVSIVSYNGLKRILCHII